MIRAICIGEAMVELRPAGPGLFARAVAGDAYNTAVYLKRSLGVEGEVAFLTAVGDDALSQGMTAEFAAEGLETGLVFTVQNGLPGLYLIELDARGDRSFHYWRSASAARRWLVELEARGGADLLAGADLIYLSGISLAILAPDERGRALALLSSLRGQVGRIAFDPNIRPRLWPDLTQAREAVEAAYRLADIVLPSLVDGELTWGETAPSRQLDRYGALTPKGVAPEVALTLGEEGVRLRFGDETLTLPALIVQAVDTSGAGDSFNGAYLAERLCGADSLTSARAGLALAARVVTAPGALIPATLSHPHLAEQATS
jgi:2-dehydro-3-deoxygluconokinase